MSPEGQGERQRFAGTTEEAVLRIGFYVVILWLVSIILTSWYVPRYCLGMLRIVSYQAFGGRAAGITAGTVVGLPKWLIVTMSFAVDMTAVFLVYPLIIYSYKYGVRRWLPRGTIQSTIESAHKRRRWVARYGLIALIFFVWFPFYMTGPLVGAVIGYFLGLRAWVNLSVVSFGTLLAVISWTFVFDWLYVLLKEVAGELMGYAPLAVLALVLLVVLAVRLGTRWRRKRTDTMFPERSELPGGDGAAGSAPPGDTQGGEAGRNGGG